MIIIHKGIRSIAIYTLIALIWTGVCQSQDYKYKVFVDTKQKQLSVKACFSNSPSYFYATTKNAERITTNIQWKSESRNYILKQKDGSIDTPKNQKGCLSYVVQTRLLRDRLNSSNFKKQHPEDFILSIGTWIWKPSDFKHSTKISIEFIHKDGIQVSAPWLMLNKSATQTSYLMEFTPDDWPGYVAFGRFQMEKLTIGDSLLNIALIHGSNRFNKSDILDWIKEMTSAVASIGAEFPIKETQVLVIIQKGSSGAVPWGQVNRAGLPGVLFIVNPDRSKHELMQDWTAAHEFSHLLIPYTPEDRWFSEGFASYYQNISRARVGLINERQTWEKLIAGFYRGRKAASQSDAQILKRANSRSLMQMYWGGAVIALKAEVALIKHSSGKMNLSTVIKQLNDCCLHTRRSWTAKQTFLRMDEITGTSIFTQLYYQEVMNNKFPEFKSLLKQLGIFESIYGGLRFDATDDKIALRKEIING